MINPNGKIELMLFEALLRYVSDDKILVFNFAWSNEYYSYYL